MGNLNGKVSLVTGASRGIGEATALRLAEIGSSLFLAADGTAEELEAVARECRRLSPVGAEAKWGIFDLAEVGQAEKMATAAIESFGRADVLVNNAGVRCRKPFGELTHEDYDLVMTVNLRAPIFASQAVLPAMRRQGGGRIINVASQMGMVAKQDLSLYSTSKAALIHLTRSMALELAKDGIAVNAVSPGPIETPYTIERLRDLPGFRETALAYVPLGRLGKPGEVAEAIVFLASCDGNFVHGHNLVIDGGHVIH
ncbi:MAG: glucose 1-dehydrogenase [Proteobacteria bacterium]|nr:glucose 1-dehydrogenase [Pseudomonadota bacterium]